MRDPITEPPSMKVYVCTIRSNPHDTHGTDYVDEVFTDYQMAMDWLDRHSMTHDRFGKVERRGYGSTVFRKVDDFRYEYTNYRVHIHDIYGVIPYEPAD